MSRRDPPFDLFILVVIVVIACVSAAVKTFT